VVRANDQYISLMVSLSNHEQKRSSFDRLRTSGVLNRPTHHASAFALRRRRWSHACGARRLQSVWRNHLDRARPL